MGHIFCTEIEILNCRSHDISQKLRQTKCLIFNFWMIRLIKTPILPNCQVQIAFFGIIVHFSLQILKSIHLVFLSFWDMSCDLQFRILISVQKMCPIVNLNKKYWLPPSLVLKGFKTAEICDKIWILEPRSWIFMKSKFAKTALIDWVEGEKKLRN